jgi:hypothetical protein
VLAKTVKKKSQHRAVPGTAKGTSLRSHRRSASTESASNDSNSVAQHSDERIAAIAAAAATRVGTQLLYSPLCVPKLLICGLVLLHLVQASQATIQRQLYDGLSELQAQIKRLVPTQSCYLFVTYSHSATFIHNGGWCAGTRSTSKTAIKCD